MTGTSRGSRRWAIDRKKLPASFKLAGSYLLTKLFCEFANSIVNAYGAGGRSEAPGTRPYSLFLWVMRHIYFA